MLTLINPGKILTPWVLALEQKLYMPYIKKVIKKILQTAGPSHSSLGAIIFLFLNISYIILHNGHFRNLKQISCYQKKTILHTFSTISHMIDVY